METDDREAYGPDRFALSDDAHLARRGSTRPDSKILFRMVPGVFANGFGALPPPPLGLAARNGMPDAQVSTPRKMPEMLSQNPTAEPGKSPRALSVV